MPSASHYSVISAAQRRAKINNSTLIENLDMSPVNDDRTNAIPLYLNDGNNAGINTFAPFNAEKKSPRN